MKHLLLSLLMTTLAVAADSNVSDITVKDIDGKETTLKTYAGKVLLIVNVASECGYTGQYAGLQALHEKMSGKGLAVLGFPCNDFGGQEPGTEAAIKTFCTDNYKVTFPMFSKVAIKGDAKHPLYAALQSTAGEVGWNFEKFLVSKDGNVLKRFGSDVEPDSPELMTAIEAALK
ncbi:MAG: glutathione peroxidase [Prosthecobacter sp.]|jgi:glutathione peroxidase|uniref:glutathione peroxidase n=1 Tax=Prosthecobacter sp. TaxID=1965333 RepID=UPI0019EE8961|nr:glutathione peroxidase [Prosthecobacter sp.]MBE2283096.1 glutathione peroxidase [Prosthecobacter sp.]